MEILHRHSRAAGDLRALRLMAKVAEFPTRALGDDGEKSMSSRRRRGSSDADADDECRWIPDKSIREQHGFIRGVYWHSGLKPLPQIKPTSPFTAPTSAAIVHNTHHLIVDLDTPE